MGATCCHLTRCLQTGLERNSRVRCPGLAVCEESSDTPSGNGMKHERKWGRQMGKVKEPSGQGSLGGSILDHGSSGLARLPGATVSHLPPASVSLPPHLTPVPGWCSPWATPRRIQQTGPVWECSALLWAGESGIEIQTGLRHHTHEQLLGQSHSSCLVSLNKG